MKTLVLEIIKVESVDETKYSIIYSKSKAETITNESDIDFVFESIYITIISNKQKSINPKFHLLLIKFWKKKCWKSKSQY